MALHPCLSNLKLGDMVYIKVVAADIPIMLPVVGFGFVGEMDVGVPILGTDDINIGIALWNHYMVKGCVLPTSYCIPVHLNYLRTYKVIKIVKHNGNPINLTTKRNVS